MSDKKPFEIARETLKLLTARKLLPTPLNYQSLYNEIAGLPQVTPFPQEVLRDIVKDLPAKTPGQQKQKGLLVSAVERMQWEGVKNALMAYGGFVPMGAPDTAPSPASSPVLEKTSADAPGLTPDFMAQIGRLIEYAQPALGHDDPRFEELTTVLVAAFRKPDSNLLELKRMLADYSHRLSFAAEDQAEIKSTLLKLLHLIFENIGDLGIEDQWLKGQMDALMQCASPPLSLRRLDDMERKLKDVIVKQKDAKDRALQVQHEMRAMLVTFIGRLTEMVESSGLFSQKLEDSARKIEQAQSLTEIAPVLKEVVLASRNMVQSSQASREAMQAMRERVEKADAELLRLHQELDRVSAQARHDPLTGALNRKGLDETLQRELAIVQRQQLPLSMALLDIDNFKLLNDRLGHATGDAALTHLATVAREALRPKDSLARYGGEEFLILMPETSLDMAVEVMVRLQRELTRRFFLAGTEKVLITFSAGVSLLAQGESGMDAIHRADQAMYLAKRAGKNRVVAA